MAKSTPLLIADRTPVATGIVITTEMSLYGDRVSLCYIDTNLGRRLGTAYTLSELLKLIRSKKIIDFNINTVDIILKGKTHKSNTKLHTASYNIRKVFGKSFEGKGL